MIDITFDIFILHIRELLHSPYYQGLIWLVVFDVLTGYAKAIKYKSLDSAIGTNGIIRHALVVLLVTVFGVYARALGYRWVSIAFASAFIANYGLSLAENAEALGLNMPSWVTQYFARMRSDYGDRLDKSKKDDNDKMGGVK